MKDRRKFTDTINRRICTAVLAVLFSLLSVSSVTAEETIVQIIWEEIPELVRNGNSAWKAVSETAEWKKNEKTAACDAFREELSEEVELIDKELEQIRLRKAELRKRNGSTVIDDKGTTAARQLEQETENERLLKESRRRAVTGAAAAVYPMESSFSGDEENLKLQFDTIVSGVQELYLSRQQLAAQQASLTALLEAQEVRAKAVNAAFERGMTDQSTNESSQLSLRQLRSQRESLDKSLLQLDRSLKTSLGIDPEAKAVFGPVPPVDEAAVSAIDPGRDLKKLLENSEDLKNSEGEKNWGKFGSDQLQKDEVNRIRGEITASVEDAYRELQDTRLTVAERKKELSEAEAELRLKEKQYQKGRISQLDLLEAKASYEETNSLEVISELAYRKAMDAYLGLTDIRVTDPDAGPGTSPAKTGSAE